MSNLLQYTIQLRDQMSSVLNRLIGSTRSTKNNLNQLQRDALNGSRALREMGANANVLRQKLDQLKGQREFIRTTDIQNLQRYNREISLLERQISRISTKKTGIASSISQAFKAIPFSNLLTNPIVLATAGIAKTFSVGMQNEMNKTAFSVLLKSDDAAEQLMAGFKNIKMDKNILGENAKTMLGFGLSEKDILPMLESIGNISMGDANRMGSLTLAFSQMTSTGKLMGQDLLQMINAGFNPLNEISKKTGKSIGDLKKEMEKGTISAKMVQDAFLSASGSGGQFEGMLNKQAQTLGGRWNSWMVKASDMFITFYNLVNPLVVKMMELAEKGFGFVADNAKMLFNAFKNGNTWVWIITGAIAAYTIGMTAASVITSIKAGIDYIASGALWAQVTAWWNLNRAMYANPLGLIIAGVIALIALIGYIIYKVDGWGKAWDYTVQGVTIIWNAFSTQAKSSFDILINGFMIGINKIQQGWYKFKNAVGLGNSAENDSMIASLDSQIEKRKKIIAKDVNDFKGASYKGAGDALKNGFNALSWNSERSLGSLIGDTKSKLGISDAKTGIGTDKDGKIETNLAGKGRNEASKTNQATATGGSKSNFITINLDSLVKAMTINTANSEDTANQIQQKTTDALLRTLAMATTAGS